MQIIIDIKKEQDLQVLLPLLERLKIAYKSLPHSKAKNMENVSDAKSVKLSEKYAGKLSPEAGEALHKQVTQSRDEWERIKPLN